jgi:drug/metabolite transporter superfamily protein YnfA
VLKFQQIMLNIQHKVNCSGIATKLGRCHLVNQNMGTLRWADLRLAALTTILVLAAYIGVVQGFNAAHSARNLAESATAAAQLGYGTLAFFALIAILQKHRFARPLIEFFGAIFVATAIMMPVVFENATVKRGILSGVVASLLVALIVWLWGTLQQAPAAREIKTEKTRAPVQAEAREDAIDRELAELKKRMRQTEPALATSGPVFSVRL